MSANILLIFVTIFVSVFNVIAADEVGDAAAVEQLLSSISSKQPIKTETQISLLTTLKDSWESSDPKPAWGEKLKKAIKDLPPITPTIENPIQATDWLRNQVRLETFARLNLFEAEDSFVHPASNDYPGEVPKGPNLEQMYNFTIPLEKDVAYSTFLENQCHNAEKVVQLNQTGKISCLKYCSSMLYAVPGSKLKITFTSENIAGFVVRIGHFEDDTSGLDNWRQYPNMRHDNSFLFPPSVDNATTTEVEMPIIFGGIVYIGQINSSITLDNITFQMSGVVESPSYKFPDMNLLEWREERRVMTAPWGDLISPQLTISYPRRVLVKIEDPEELLIHWERMIDGINEVDATPYKGTREHIGFARDLPENGTRIHAGWPIMAVENVGEDLVEFSQLWMNNSKNMDAIFRALGQNHERHLSLLSLNKKKSLLPELFLDYIKNIVHGVTPHQIVKNEYKAENIVKVLGPYLKNGAKFEKLFSSGAATLFYFDIVRNFGWAMINKIANASRFSTVSGEDATRDALITHVSQFQQENVAEYFKSWGISFSKEVENGMKKLPKCGFTAKQLLDFANKQIKEAKKSVGRGFKKPKKTPTKKEKEEEKVLDHDELPEEIDPLAVRFKINETDVENEIEVFVSKQQGRGMRIANPAEVEKRRSLWVRDTSATDLEQLLANVTEVKPTSDASELVLIGEDAFPVLAGRLSRSTVIYVPVVAAAKYGKGRVVAVAGGTILPNIKEMSEKNITDFPYFDQFRLNCLMWAGQYDAAKPENFKPVIAVVPGYHWGGYQEIANFLTDTGFPTEQINADKIDLDKYNLVMIPYGYRLTTQFDNATKLEEFVKNGGGLIFYIEGRAFSKQKVDNMPLNKLALLAGISFTNEWAMAAANDRFTGARDLLEITAFNSAGKRLLEMEFGDSNMDTVTRTIRNGFLYRNASELAKSTWIKVIKTKFLNLPPLTPMPNASVAKTDELMARLRFEDFVMEHILDANDHYEHPAAKSFPGRIPPESDLSKVYSSAVTLDVNPVFDILKKDNTCRETENYNTLYSSDSTKTSCRRTVWNGQWPCLTHFYAPPGVKITIKFTSPSNAVKSFSISTGRFIDITQRSEWDRYPLIEFEEIFYTNVAEFSSPFGGPLYIGDIVTPIDTDTVSYTISGVTETPHFYLGTTRLSDWTKRFSKSNAPWGILAGQNIQIRMPVYAFKLIKNPEELMLTWQHMIDGFDEFHTLDYRMHLHILNYDIMLTNSAAYMLSGKVQAKNWAAKYVVDMQHMWCFLSGGDTTVYGHEFGHNLDPSWWHFNGGVDVTNNVNYQYYIPTVFGKRKNNLFPKATISDPNIVSGITNFENIGLNYLRFMAVGEIFFYDLHSNFGFNVIFKLMRLAKGVSFPNEDFRLDWFFVNLSEILKRNMESYLNTWGMKPSKEAVEKVKDYPSTNYTMSDLFNQAKERVDAREEINKLTKSLTGMLNEFKKIQDKTKKISTDELRRIGERVDKFIKGSFNTRNDRNRTVMDKMNTFKTSFREYSVKTLNSTEQKMTTKLNQAKDVIIWHVNEKLRNPQTKGLVELDAFVQRNVEEIQKSFAKLEKEIKARAWLGIDYAGNRTRDELQRFTDIQKSNEDRGMNETKRYISEAIGKYNTICQGEDSALTNFSKSVIPPFKKLMQNVEETAATLAKKVHRPVQIGTLLAKDSKDILNQGKKALKEIEESISPMLNGKSVEKLKANLTNKHEGKWAEYRTVVQFSRDQIMSDFAAQFNQTNTAIRLEEGQLLKDVQELTEKKIKEFNAYFEDLKAKSA